MTAIWLNGMALRSSMIYSENRQPPFGIMLYSSFAAQQFRHLADETGGFADEQSLDAGHAIDHAEADIACKTQHGGVVGEQPIEPVGGQPHGHGVEPPPALITLQHRRGAWIEAEPRGVDDHLGEGGDVLQPHVQPLTGDRMNDVGGVANRARCARR